MVNWWPIVLWVQRASLRDSGFLALHENKLLSRSQRAHGLRYFLFTGRSVVLATSTRPLSLCACAVRLHKQPMSQSPKRGPAKMLAEAMLSERLLNLCKVCLFGPGRSEEKHFCDKRHV